VLTSNQLDALQQRQLAHDEAFHKDIVVMPIIQIIKHMTLHQAKYAGKMAVDSVFNSDPLRRIVIDMHVICLATANALKCKLSDIDIDELEAHSFYESVSSRPPLQKFMSYVGQQAKSCEAWDHLEDHDYLNNLRITNSLIYLLTLQLADANGMDLWKAYHQRISNIEKKHIFYSQLQTGSRYVIQKVGDYANEVLYWNNTNGFGDLASATVFTLEDQQGSSHAPDCGTRIKWVQLPTQ